MSHNPGHSLCHAHPMSLLTWCIITSSRVSVISVLLCVCVPDFTSRNKTGTRPSSAILSSASKWQAACMLCCNPVRSASGSGAPPPKHTHSPRGRNTPARQVAAPCRPHQTSKVVQPFASCRLAASGSPARKTPRSLSAPHRRQLCPARRPLRRHRKRALALLPGWWLAAKRGPGCFGSSVPAFCPGRARLKRGQEKFQGGQQRAKVRDRVATESLEALILPM